MSWKLISVRDVAHNLEIDGINAILEKGGKQARKSNVDAYIDIILRANKKTLTGAKKMLADTLAEIFEETGWTQKWLERGIEQGMERGIEQGMERGMERGIERGIEQGMERGREESLETVVRNASVQGLSLDIIQTITGLDKNTIITIQTKEKWKVKK